MTRTLSTIVIAFILVLRAAAAPAQPAGPDAEIRTRVDAFIAALRNGSADQLEAAAQTHGAPELLARRTPAERRTLFQRIVTDFGAVTVTSVRVEEGRATIEARGATGLLARGLHGTLGDRLIRPIARE